MFNNGWIEANNNCLELKETLFKPLIIVLKIVYGFDINDKECNEFKIQELNEALIIANKYQFIRVEKLLSQKIISKLPPIYEMKAKTSLNIWDLFEMSKIHELLDLSEECLKYFDENVDQILEAFDYQFINPETILEIISRDSFVVKEIVLFNAIIKWINKTRPNFGFKFYEDEELLLKAIRFNLISAEDINSCVKPAISKLFSDSIVNDVLNDLINNNLNKTDLIRVKPEKLFNVINSLKKRSSYRVKDFKLPVIPIPAQVLLQLPQEREIPCLFYEFNLPFVSKINCIQFSILPKVELDLKYKSFSYLIEVRNIDPKEKKEWITVIDYRKYKCFGLQELYFEDIFTDSIRIVSLVDENEEIPSLSYKYTKTPPKLLDAIVQPLNDITTEAKCLVSIDGREGIITDYILRDEKLVENDLVLMFKRPKFPEIGLNPTTSYFICFSQPFAIDSFQFETILEINDSQTKYEAVFEVSISSSYDFRNRFFAENSSRNSVKVSEAIIKESMTCNVVFDLQPVSVIKIYGFRFRTDYEQMRIPLDISRVRVAVNRESNQWIEGKVLPLSSPDNSLIHQLLHSFW
jgi:hypothetical protein